MTPIGVSPSVKPLIPFGLLAQAGRALGWHTYAAEPLLALYESSKDREAAGSNPAESILFFGDLNIFRIKDSSTS